MSSREHISAWYRGQRISVPVAAITHFSADSKYVAAHHPGGELLLLESLVALAKEFPEFICIRRGLLVRRALIVSFRVHRPPAFGADGGFVRCQGVGELRVSRSRASAVKDLLAGQLLRTAS